MYAGRTVLRGGGFRGFGWLAFQAVLFFRGDGVAVGLAGFDFCDRCSEQCPGVGQKGDGANSGCAVDAIALSRVDPMVAHPYE